MGEILGAIIGMTLIGAGIAWLIRKMIPMDFAISVAIAMFAIPFLAGLTNSGDSRPYWITVAVYLVAALPAYFIVIATARQHVQKQIVRGMEESLGLADFGREAALSASMDTAATPGTNAYRAPKSTIAWRRGFFRLWAVAALLWVALVALMLSAQVSSPYVPTKAVATLSSAPGPQLFDDYGAPYRGWSEAAAKGELIATVVRPGYQLFTLPDITGSALDSEIRQARQIVDAYVVSETTVRRNSALGTLLSASLIPPIVVLILGWLLGWAISGFRQLA